MVNPEKTRPQLEFKNNGHTLTLPELRNVVRSLDQVVEVDYYIPGCPPTPKITQAAVGALLAGKLPPKGSVLAPDIALCDQCPRKATKPADLSFTEFKRPHLTRRTRRNACSRRASVCMGPATRGGCEAALPGGGMPCTGCFGPTSRVRDQGAKILSSPLRQHRCEGRKGNRQNPRRHPRPGRHLLPLWSGQEPAATESGSLRMAEREIS